MVNPHIFLAFATEIILGICLAYVPFLNTAFNTRPIPFWYFMVPALQNFVEIFFYDEARKSLVRAGQFISNAGRLRFKGWMARNTYW